MTAYSTTTKSNANEETSTTFTPKENFSTASTLRTHTSTNHASDDSTLSMTTLLEAGSTNSTVPEGQSQNTSILIYVMIPIAVLIVLEVFIFIILLRRCYAKKNDNIGRYSRHNSVCEEDQHSIFAVENKAYTGFILPETQTDDSVITGNRNTKTDENVTNNIRTGQQQQKKNDPGHIEVRHGSTTKAKETGEQQLRKRIDPGYQAVKIESPTETKETGDQNWRRKIDPGYLEVQIESPEATEIETNHHMKSNTTEFVNRTYSHIEGFPPFQPVSNVDLPYSHVDKMEEDDNYNRLSFKTQIGVVNKTQVETEAENDTEYDHTSSVRKRQPIKDDINYSHVSIAIPRPQTILRSKEDNVTVTRPNEWSMHNKFTKPHASDTKGNYEKRNTSVDYHDITFKQDMMSGIEAKHKSLYSEVIKDIDKKRYDITMRARRETEKSKLNDTSPEIKYEYSQVVKKTKSPNRDEKETANPKAKDNPAFFIIGDENNFHGSKRNWGNDYIETEKRDLNGTSREMKYEYSQVKKTKSSVRKKVEIANPRSKDTHAGFIICDENDCDDTQKNQKHDYVNIVEKQ